MKKFNNVLEMSNYWHKMIIKNGKSPFIENEMNSALRTFSNRGAFPTCEARITGKIADFYGYMNEGWSLGI